MNIDPIEAEFFSTEALGSLADALVREAIQNSLDARLPGVQLKIRIFFPPPAAMLEGERKEHYTANLSGHLSASRSGLTALPLAPEPLSFIAIEDFGTRGLQGNPEQSEDEEIEDFAGTRNDFFFFWRNIGRSRKHASELGRWGLGKTVFQAASRINAFFALTVRANDRRRLMLGQSVLKIHKLNGQRFYPYGYFGRFDRDFALPVDDDGYLDRFCQDFHLARSAVPGLSVIVPYPDPELTPQALISSIVRHYFMPIISRDLIVEIVHGGKTQQLDDATLLRFFPQESAESDFRLQEVFNLARWGIGLPRAEHVRLQPPPQASAPRWADDCLSPPAVARLRERFDANEPVAVTVPVWVKPVTGESLLSQFDVYLERAEALASADEHFVRDGITISGVRASMPKGTRAILAVRDRPLSELLGDSENPAHTEWQERSPKFKDRYRHGPYTLRYVKNAPREIVRLLTRPSEGRDLRLLQQLFSLHIPTEDTLKSLRKAQEEKHGMGDGLGQDGVESVAKDRLFQLQKLRGGFRLTGAANGGRMPKYAAIWVAYDVRRGNPFSQYQPPDFEMNKAPIVVEAESGAVSRCQANLLVLRIQQTDFQLTVKGFDLHRDIRVKVLPVDEAVGP